ncbi:FecR family protein [Pedobacter rhizosphaerae]|uniref:FecR family protein n=1 Tax=Pedobacter rhizosphaerae TaxID=390241 RepID=A0A1H9K987_9SPHI|nr:FecR family protein [Pedobacter rhizosphaerae]SEQ95632.1 FecR family protein [Pedobacter rhizosphaerae]
MTEEQYLLLCENYLADKSSPDEVEKLRSYQISNGLANLDIDQIEKARLHSVLFDRVQQSINFQTPRKKLWFIIPFLDVAAVFIAALATIFFVYQYQTDTAVNKENSQTKHVAKVDKDIAPGKANAVLQLADGSTIQLEKAGNGLLSKKGNSSISKSGEGIVLSGKETHVGNTETALNKIVIPRAGKYNITLSDGTRVWLNSSSSLSFPTIFSGKSRKVYLSGEAYFEVAKNKQKPFIVDVNGKQEVEVLGTHFNITAFNEDKDITTALLEGAVRVSANNLKQIIHPGEMVVNNLQNKLSVKQADLEEIMAWKNDMFIFNNENITSVMKKITRWYDVDVVYKGDMSQVNFDGNYSRSKGLKSLLNNIALLDKVQFIIEGRRITVIAR